MKNQHTRMSIGAQAKSANRPAALTSFLPLALFAALVAAIAIFQ